MVRGLQQESSNVNARSGGHACERQLANDLPSGGSWGDALHRNRGRALVGLRKLPRRPQPDPFVTAEGQTSGQKSTKESKIDLGINLLQTAGAHFGLPTSGILHLVMKDGTTQDVDLSKVKTATVTKQ